MQSSVFVRQRTDEQAGSFGKYPSPLSLFRESWGRRTMTGAAQEDVRATSSGQRGASPFSVRINARNRLLTCPINLTYSSMSESCGTNLPLKLAESANCLNSVQIIICTSTRSRQASKVAWLKGTRDSDKAGK